MLGQLITHSFKIFVTLFIGVAVLFSKSSLTEDSVLEEECELYIPTVEFHKRKVEPLTVNRKDKITIVPPGNVEIVRATETYNVTAYHKIYLLLNRLRVFTRLISQTVEIN